MIRLGSHRGSSPRLRRRKRTGKTRYKRLMTKLTKTKFTTGGEVEDLDAAIASLLPLLQPSVVLAAAKYLCRPILLGICCWFLTGTMTLAAPSLTSRLDREVVPVGESVTLTLTFEEANPRAAPNLPGLPNLNVTSVGQSSEFTIVNGQSASRISFNYTLVPTKPGEVTIPAMQVQIDGRVLTSQPLKLKVVTSNAA